MCSVKQGGMIIKQRLVDEDEAGWQVPQIGTRVGRVAGSLPMYSSWLRISNSYEYKIL